MIRALMIAICLVGSHAHAQNVEFTRPLITDVSIRDIQIHSGFSGTTLLFYGARNAPGDIVIALRGPEMKGVIRRKDQVGGVWMVVEQSRYETIPSFYQHASTQPLRSILTREGYGLYSLGNQGLYSLVEQLNPETSTSLNNALIGQLKKRGWVTTTPNPVEYFGDALFKATMQLPDNMPRGLYFAEILLIHQGKITSSQTIPITAKKIGMDAWLSKQANEQPWAYGFAAVFLALFGGWLGNRMLGR